MKNAFINLWFAVRGDFAEIEEVIKKYKIQKEQVFLMPCGVSREEVLALGGRIADYCKANGYRFTTRLHMLLWGNKRGV